MATSKPITWLISDIVNWFKNKELIINDSFQRHSVWSPQAKTLLIDSILNELPLPKIFIRTKIDSKLQKTLKEIVDGQQRIRSIVEFANGDFALSNKSEKFHGMRYHDLDEGIQQAFLGYVITAEQLLNASDDDVVDIFARLNSYTVALNSAEKRHTAFQTELKFFVRKMSIKYRWFVEKYGFFSIKQRFRMLDDEFFAELIRLVNSGIQDGGSERITKYYQATTDKVFTDSVQGKSEATLDELIRFLDSGIGEFLKGPLGKHYQLYAICAAYLHIKNEIPRFADMPNNSLFKSIIDIKSELANLEREFDTMPESSFVKASSSSTQRITSRLIRIKKFIEIFGA